MLGRYFAVTLPLYLSILVVFLVPMVEAATLIHFAPDFLLYIGLAVPILTLLTLGTRLYAQLDANAEAGSPAQLGAAVQRSLIVTAVLLVASIVWVFAAIDWTGRPWEWPWLICALLLGGAMQTPRYFAQSVSATSARGLPSLLAAIVMVAVSALVCLAVWLAGPPPRSAVAIVMTGSTLAAVAGAALTIRLFSREVEWRRALSLRPPQFRASILRTHAFAMLEVASYNLMYFAFFTALSKQSAGDATTFQFIGTLSLLGVAWRIAYSILFQTAVTRLAHGAATEDARLLGFALPALANSTVGIALAVGFAMVIWPDGSYALPVSIVLLINAFGTFNMLALSGLRAIGRMGRMGVFSAAVNSVSIGAFLLAGDILGTAGIFCVFVLDEIVRATCSNYLFHVGQAQRMAFAPNGIL